ncbi:replication initiation factor domain-containing protein [Faecalicatena acetigenes]|uniref:Replication initiation factor domain-containing protein n=1 Tax=Faecalicatena acetigenes TaxID=2981790 RepID=A0ABT2TBA2_9FIRM|nr:MULTISPECIES: replication initiation factor domain-containing protein [Lachnospiraceae]MCU6747517.1 replication initiation factor domain-containing protein [Faecalicatena acetigenes]SCH93429.1 Replication initiation factor [uncultured Clostridium sp.]
MDDKTWWEVFEKERKEKKIQVKKLCLLTGITEGRYRQLRLEGKIAPDLQDNLEKWLDCLSDENPLELLIDYIRLRFDKELLTMEYIAEKLIGVPWEMWGRDESQQFNYEIVYTFGNIRLCTSASEELGFLLEMGGQACRQLEMYMEASGRTWINFFSKAYSMDAHFKRIDFAIDDFYGMLDIDILNKALEEDNVITEFRSKSLVSSGELRQEKDLMGRTLYMGRRKSKVYFCIYEKDYEQYVKQGIPIENTPVKVRFELRLADKRAEKAVEQLLQKYTDGEEEYIEAVIFGIINKYATFLVPEKGKKKRERDALPMWEYFVTTYGWRNPIRLAVRPEPFNELRSLNAFSKQWAPTVKAFMIRDKKENTKCISHILECAEPRKQVLKVLGYDKAIAEKLNIKFNRSGKIWYGESEEENGK